MGSEEKAKRAAYMREYTAKNCERINAQRRARYKADPSKILVAQREYKASPEVKAHYRDYMKTYFEINKEKVKLQRAEYRKVNAEKIREQHKADHAAHKVERNVKKLLAYHTDPQKTIDRNRDWRNRNPEKILAKNQRRRAARAGVEVENISTKDIYERDKGVCGICGKHLELRSATLDHITPLMLGGPHTSANLQIAHRSCNSSKGTRLIAKNSTIGNFKENN